MISIYVYARRRWFTKVVTAAICNHTLYVPKFWHGKHTFDLYQALKKSKHWSNFTHEDDNLNVKFMLAETGLFELSPLNYICDDEEVRFNEGRCYVLI